MGIGSNTGAYNHRLARRSRLRLVASVQEREHTASDIVVQLLEFSCCLLLCFDQRADGKHFTS